MTSAFSEPAGKFTVLRLELSRFEASGPSLPPGYGWGGPQERASRRGSERDLLALCFADWTTPYHGLLKGWREDSPLYVLHQGELSGGAYLCERNEFNDDPRAGQLNYTFIHPAHRGKGLYSALFARAVEKARLWGLTELFMNTDRRGLPEMYLRWGFHLWKTIPKRPRIGSAFRLRPPPQEDDACARVAQARASGSPRVMILGDSFSLETSGKGPRPGVETAMSLLSAHLAAKGVFTLNLASSGEGPLDYLEKLRAWGERCLPHLIIVNYYVGNNLTATQYQNRLLRACKGWLSRLAAGRAWLRLRQARDAKQSRSRIRKRMRESRLLGEARNPVLADLARAHPDYLLDNLLMEKRRSQKAWDANKKAVLAIKEEARRLGARLLVNVFPSPAQSDPRQLSLYGKLGFFLDQRLLVESRPQGLLKEFCRQEALECHDLLPCFRARPGGHHLEDDGHWNAAGNLLAFTQIKERLAALGF